MARWKINVHENVIFNHDVYLETDLNEEQLDAALGKVQDKLLFDNNLDGVIDGLEKEGLKVVDYTRDESGWGVECEIEDMEEVEE